METVIGVFGSRERAEETIKELLNKHVPQDAIVFLTRSESEAMPPLKSLGAFGGVTAGGDTPQPTLDEKSSEDLAFFGEVLNAGRSLIVVRTVSQEIAKVTAEILDRMGISAQWRMSGRMQTASQQIGGISVVDVQGKITVGDGNIMLREVVMSLLKKGDKRILLNLGGVAYVDSSGLGELVRTHTTLQRQGGQLKMVNLNQKVQELFKATGLDTVFDVHKDEVSALQSFNPLATEANG